MTLEQWNELRVGDVVLDRHHRNARRRIFAISRVSGKRTQRGLTRTALTVTNLKSAETKTIIFETENTGPSRFDLASRNGAA